MPYSRFMNYLLTDPQCSHARQLDALFGIEAFQVDQNLRGTRIRLVTKIQLHATIDYYRIHNNYEMHPIVFGKSTISSLPNAPKMSTQFQLKLISDMREHILHKLSYILYVEF